MTDQAIDSGPPRRSVRSSEQVRRLLLSSARELFVARGYEQTTTREIAAHAGVAERLLFSNFGTKAALFEHAVLHPFQDAVDEFLRSWSDRRSDSQPVQVVVRTFIEAAYDLLRTESSRLLLMMLAVEQFNQSQARRTRNPLLPLLDEMERVTAYEHGRMGWTGVNLHVAARAVFGMIAFNAAFGAMLYPIDAQLPDRDAVIDELTAFVLAGNARSAWLSAEISGSAEHPMNR